MMARQYNEQKYFIKSFINHEKSSDISRLIINFGFIVECFFLPKGYF